MDNLKISAPFRRGVAHFCYNEKHWLSLRSGKIAHRKYSAIDLFSGAGGFSLGMEQAGFRVLGAVDSDDYAVKVYQDNLKHEIINHDITKLPPAEFTSRTGIREIDVIFGGPPCQGFSTARPVNHGELYNPDGRRFLYRNFLNYVQAFSPQIFVMENVAGIQKAAGGSVFRAIEKNINALGYSMHFEKLRAWHFGVPQKRIRCIIVGIRNDLPPVSDGVWVKPTHADSLDSELPAPVTLREAISDLPHLTAGQSTDQYDLNCRKRALARQPDYLRNVIEIEKATVLNAHSARKHSERDMRDFKRLKPGQTSADALRLGVEMEFPYSRDKFKDRFTRQHYDRQSSTIMAHLSKDGLMFIHPKQCRSFTPREAARIQSFPDWFIFPGSRTHQFRIIGNAVPPLMGKAIGKAIKRHLPAAKSGKSENRRLSVAA